MKVYIEDPNLRLFPNHLTVKEYNEKQLYALRQKVRDNIKSFFKWGDYDAKYMHLVYYAEVNGAVNVYVNGFIMTDKEFYENIDNIGIGFVGAFHKGTAKFA